MMAKTLSTKRPVCCDDPMIRFQAKDDQFTFRWCATCGSMLVESHFTGRWRLEKPKRHIKQVIDRV